MSGEKQKVSPLTEPALPSFQFSIFNSQIRKASRPLRLRIKIPVLRTERAAEPVLPVQVLLLLR